MKFNFSLAFIMEALKFIIFILVLTTFNYNISVAQDNTGFEYGKFARLSLQNVRNISSYYGQLSERFRDSVSLLNISTFNSVIRKITEAPFLKIITRVYELYRVQTKPMDVIATILSSDEMRQLIDNWLTWSGVSSDDIISVQTLVSSAELISVIDALRFDNTSSPADKLCSVHNLTKLPEFRQLLDLLATLSVDTSLSSLTSSLGNMTRLQDISNMDGDRLSNIFNLNTSGLIQVIYSPLVQTVLDIYCELTRRLGYLNNDESLIDTATQPGTETGEPDIAEAQALSNVGNLTGLSPDELLDQLQGLLDAPELGEVIGNLNTSVYLVQIIEQLQSVVVTGNLTDLLDILTQFQNGSLGNDTVTVQELLIEAVQQVNDSLGIFLPIARQFIENFFRETLKENGVSESCQDSSVVFVQALFGGETWALKSAKTSLIIVHGKGVCGVCPLRHDVFDAIGKIPSDILALRILWLGSFDECTGITSTTVGGSEIFEGKYCRATIPISAGAVEGLTLGTCVPSTCSADDTLGILLVVQKLLLNESTPIIPSISCVEELEFETDAVIVTCVLVIIGFIVVCGTLYDVIAVQLKKKRIEKNDGMSGTRESVSSTITSVTASTSSLPASLYKPIKTRLETSPGFISNVYNTGEEGVSMGEAGDTMESNINKNDVVKTEDVTLNIKNSIDEKNGVSPNDSKGSLEKVVLSFSAYTNSVKVLSTQQASGALGAINGIRFLSMAWVILGHTYYFATSTGDNLLTHYAEKTNQWTYPVVMYATVSVDSFFTISGILVGYLTLRQLQRVGGAKKMNWFLFYFHRFWRLTPSYMLILMVATVLLPHLATGPMWTEEFPGTGGCRQYWWTNLLYINNFVNIYPETDMCMGWTWYLADDMQFYILSPLILVPLFYNVIAGLVSCIIFLVATITTTAILVHKYEYPAQQANFIYAPAPGDANSFQKVYIPAYTRMGPYIIGLFTGYLLYRLKSKCRIPKMLNLFCWLVCISICCLTVYGPYSYEDRHIFTQLQSDVFLAVHRTGWGLAVSWIVFACATDNGGWINDVLSWKPFIPLGRLTYGAYLLHPLAIFLFYSTRRIPTYFTDYEVVYLFIGHVALSYGAAFIVGLLFESPMMGLEKVFFTHKKTK